VCQAGRRGKGREHLVRHVAALRRRGLLPRIHLAARNRGPDHRRRTFTRVGRPKVSGGTTNTKMASSDAMFMAKKLLAGEEIRFRKKPFDRDVLRLIKMWLQAPVEERDGNGKRRMSGGKDHHCGTPQGGVASPMLANLYMNRLLKGWRQTKGESSSMPMWSTTRMIS
jgi:hypothetical protein